MATKKSTTTKGGVTSIKNRFESGNVAQDEGTKPAPAPRISDIAKKFTEKPPAPQPPPPSKIAALSKKFEAAKKPAMGANTAAISKTFEQPPEKTKHLKKPVVWGTPPRKKPITLPGTSGSANQKLTAVPHFNKAAAPAPPPTQRTTGIAKKFAAKPTPTTTVKGGAKVATKKVPTTTKPKPKPQNQPPSHSPEKANYVPPADSIEVSNQENVSDMTKKWSQPPPEFVKEANDEIIDWGVIRMVYGKKDKDVKEGASNDKDKKGEVNEPVDEKGEVNELVDEKGEVNEPADEQSEHEDSIQSDNAQVDEEHTQHEQEETDLVVQGDETQDTSQGDETQYTSQGDEIQDTSQVEYEEQAHGDEAQEESNQVEGVDNEYVTPSVTYNPERIFLGGIVAPDEDDLQKLDQFFFNYNQNASLEDAQSVIENSSYTQLLTASTFEEIEAYSAEYTETCKVVIYKLHDSLYIALAWQTDTNNNVE